MRFLSRLTAFALLAACGGDAKPPAALTIMMFTGDLDLPEDTDLVGLYIAQIEASGRTRRVLAYEATPLREPGMPARVPFPSDFVVVSRGEADKVHVRLVAYKKQTHEVLTMRETRTSVPDDAQRGLRMNLFFTNQNNVQDATPGAAVLSAAEGLSTLDESGEISSRAFERFTSICNGAPAPEGMTAGDDGSCVALEVPVETLPLTNAPEFLAGTRKVDSCYDVHGAFATDDTAASKADVFRVATSTLPVSGECRIPLPAVFDPARLNVAMVTSDPVFEKADGTYSHIRPLAANLAFRQVGSEVVLPPHVCDLARKPVVTELAFSQRALTWGGFEPVCSKWNTADTARPSDGSAPDPLPDAGTVDSGPDASAPTSASYEVTGLTGGLREIAMRRGDLGILTGEMPTVQVALLQAPRVDNLGTQAPAPTNLGSEFGDDASLAAVATAAEPTANTGFYVRGSSGLHKVEPNGADLVRMVVPSTVATMPVGVIAELGGVGRGVWTDSSKVYFATLATPYTFPATAPSVQGFVNQLVPGLGPILPGGRFFVPEGQYGASRLECVPASGSITCEPHTNGRTDLRYLASARIGDQFYGFYQQSSVVAVFDYDDPNDVSLGTTTAPTGKTASLDDSFCGVYGVDRKKVHCFTDASFKAMLDGAGTGTTLLSGAVTRAAVAADASSLVVAYQCAGGSGVIHVTRVFSGHLHTPGVVPNRCPDADGGP